MKYRIALLFVLILLLISCAVIAETYSIEQIVPFGFVDVLSSNFALIYQKPSNIKLITSVPNGTICEIKSDERIGETIWYKVRCFDNNSTEVSGYIAGNSLKQMTVSDLIKAMSNPSTAKYMQNFVSSSMTGSSAADNATGGISFNFGELIGASVSTTPSPTATTRPTATMNPTATPQIEHTYILNTHSKVFHYPSCNSVKSMSVKNKQVITGTRQSIIDKGYRPCSKCNP